MAASYDRELIAQMLEDYSGWAGPLTPSAVAEQIDLLRAADNADAAGVHTARRLPPDGIHTCSYQCDQPECIRAQRDDLAAQAERDAAEIVRLRGEVESLRGQIHDEIAANLAFREAGGALPDEDMPTFCARLLAERDAAIAPAEAKAPAPAMPNGVEGLMQLARNWCLAWGEWAHDADPGCAKENAAEAELRAALTAALEGGK